MINNILLKYVRNDNCIKLKKYHCLDVFHKWNLNLIINKVFTTNDLKTNRLSHIHIQVVINNAIFTSIHEISNSKITTIAIIVQIGGFNEN